MRSVAREKLTDTSVNIPNQELTIMFSLEQTCSILTVKVETTESLTNALINHGIDGLTIIDYFLVAHHYLFPNKTIDFMQEFIEMCSKEDEFCIPHTRLCEMDIVQECNDGKGKLRNIIGCLTTTNGFEEGNDFKVITEGRANKIMMKPVVFKKCLMNAKNTDIFREYYSYNDQLMEHYESYIEEYQQKLISAIIDERDELITKNSQLLNTIAELNGKLQSVTKTKDANIDSDERAKIIAAYKDIFEMHIQQAKIANDNIISFLS